MDEIAEAEMNWQIIARNYKLSKSTMSLQSLF